MILKFSLNEVTKFILSVFLLVVQKDDFRSKHCFLLILSAFFIFYSAQATSQRPITPDQCEALLSTQPDSAFILAQLGIAQNEDSIAFAIIKGQALRRKGEALQAKLYFQSLLDLQMEQRQRAELYNNLGKVNANLAEYDLAVQNFLSALALMEELADQEGQAFYLNNIGIVYDLQDDYQHALDYYSKSLRLKQKLGMDKALAASFTNIGISLYHLGQIDSSLHYQRKALALFEAQGKDNSIARIKNNIGFALIDMGNYTAAENELQAALEIRTKLDDQRGIAQTTNNLAVLYTHLNRLNEGWEATQKSATIARRLELPEILKNALQQRLDILVKRKKYLDAYQLTVELDSLNQAIASQEKAKKVAELEARYENVKKEKEIAQQKMLIKTKESELRAEIARRNLFLGFSIVLLLAASAIGYGYHQKSRAGRLFQAQNILLQKESDRIRHSRETLNHELQQTKLALEDQTQILQNVYESPKSELPPHILQLSPREMQVLSFLALGWSDKEISEKLFISVTTTKTHLRRIYSKLLVKGRAEAVAMAHRYGIIGSV